MGGATDARLARNTRPAKGEAATDIKGGNNMLPENRRDLGTGIVLLLLGGWITVYALTHYRLGDLSRIGGAAYPAGVGALLALLGLIIAVSSWFRAGPSVRPRRR